MNQQLERGKEILRNLAWDEARILMTNLRRAGRAEEIRIGDWIFPREPGAASDRFCLEVRVDGVPNTGLEFSGEQVEGCVARDPQQERVLRAEIALALEELVLGPELWAKVYGRE